MDLTCAQIENQLREGLPDPDQPLEQIEQEIVDLGQQIRDLIERETLAPLGHGYRGSATRCACGGSARYVALYRRQLVTLNGCRTLRRAYYHCSACRRGFCPLDEQLQIGRSESSVGVRALAVRFASYLPFEKAAEELALVAGVRLAARTVQREAEAVGEALTQAWAKREAAYWSGKGEPSTQRPAKLQITLDGVMVPIGAEWKEAKVGAVFTIDPKTDRPVAEYTASLGDSVAFGRRLRTLAEEAGVAYCRKVAVVADGAEWIWQEVAKQFPRAVQILDFYHVTQHLWEVARARFGEESGAREWIGEQKEHLLADRVSTVIAAVEKWEPLQAAQQEVRRKVANYLRSHAHRMRYQSFREEGYQIASGVAEASCKSVVQARLKGTGMRWSRPGAEAMLQVRAAWCSAGETDFRVAARAAMLAS
jgi:Uncharacterised protein family (UPF0236)